MRELVVEGASDGLQAVRSTPGVSFAGANTANIATSIPAGTAGQYEVNSKLYPWSTIVHLTVTFPNGQPGWGSGVMVGPNDVLTAAHVVYDATQGGKATQVVAIPAWDEAAPSVFPYGSSTGVGSQILLHPEWARLGDPYLEDEGILYRGINGAGSNGPGYLGTELDVALIGLRSPLGNNTGTMGLWSGFVAGEAHQSGYPHAWSDVRLAKYSDDVAWATRETDGDNIINIDNFETYGGNSGGPIWVLGTDGRPYVAGLVSTGVGTRGVDAFALDAPFVEWLSYYIAANDSAMIM